MRHSLTILFLISVLALTALACNLGFDVPQEIPIPEVEISGEDIAAVATQAVSAAATAVDVAEAVVSEGADLVATVEVQATAVANVPPASSDAAPVSPLGSLSTVDNLFTLTVTDTEFNQFLTQQAGGAAEQMLRNPQVSFHEGIVTLTGEITQPLTAPLAANFTPVIVDGRLQFNIIDATVGGFPAPQSVLDLIQASVNTAVDQAMRQLPPGVVMETVGLSGNVLTVAGYMNA